MTHQACALRYLPAADLVWSQCVSVSCTPQAPGEPFGNPTSSVLATALLSGEAELPRRTVGVVTYQVEKSEEQWRSELSPEEYQVLRQAGTERAFTSPLEHDDDRPYVYSCRGCGADLFTTTQKFDAQCGWPSFYAPLAEDRVEYIEDRQLGMVRTEVRCANCGSHLGHVFSGEGHPTPTDLRYCINGIALSRAEAPDRAASS